MDLNTCGIFATSFPPSYRRPQDGLVKLGREIQEKARGLKDGIWMNFGSANKPVFLHHGV